MNKYFIPLNFQMSKIILLISSFISLHCVFSQVNDWEEMHLNGKVKSITQITYKVSGTKDKVEKQYKGEWIIYHFNEKGYLTEKIRLEPHDSTLDERTVYTYDHVDKLLSMKSYGKDSIPHSTHTFIYNNEGVLKMDSIYHNGRCTKYVYGYNKKGELAELAGYGNEGEYFTSYTYEYDSAGNKIIEKWTTKDDGLIYTYFNNYDQNKNLIKQVTVYPDIEGSSTVTYKYNSKNILVEENFLGPSNNVLDRDLYKLDPQHNWIEKLTIEFKKVFVLVERKLEYFQ